MWKYPRTKPRCSMTWNYPHVFHVLFSLEYWVIAIANVVWIIDANLEEYDEGRYCNCVRCGR